VASSATPVDAFEFRRRNPFERFSALFTLMILLAIAAFFSAQEGRKFLDFGNFENIALNAAQLLLLTVGVTFVIITAGIDLSIGSVLIFSAVAAALVMRRLAGSPEEVNLQQFPNQEIAIPIGLAVGMLSGLAWGIANGVLITRLRMPPFIVTLGTLGMALGAAQLLSKGTTIRNVPRAVQTEVGLRELVGVDVAGDRLSLTPPLLIAIVVIVIAWLALSKTRFGRYTYAIGSNANAVRRVGVNVDAHLIKVYALSGFLAGVAGCFDLMRFGTASVGTHDSDNLAAISASVIGGTSLFGGIGTIAGAVIGAFIPAVLRNGTVIMGVSPFWQQVVIGAILIVAVFLDQRRRRAEERM
jgi:ribose transport system permease protein